MKFPNPFRPPKKFEVLLLGDLAESDIPAGLEALDGTRPHPAKAEWSNAKHPHVSHLSETQLRDLAEQYTQFLGSKATREERTRRDIGRFKSCLYDMLGHKLTIYVVLVTFDAYRVAAKTSAGPEPLIELLCTASENPDGYKAGVLFGRGNPRAVVHGRFDRTFRQQYDYVASLGLGTSIR